MGDAPKHLRDLLKSKYGAFIYNKQIHLPVTLKGSPENLFLNVKEGIVFMIGGSEMTFLFDGDLDSAIRRKHIYDFSKEYKRGDVEFVREIDFLIDNYVLPYQK